MDGGSITGLLSIDLADISSSEAGGTQIDGLDYDISAKIDYVYNATLTHTPTSAETVTVKPMPKLVLDYELPYVVMAGKPVKIKVKVTNQGYGPAKSLIISVGPAKNCGKPEQYPHQFRHQWGFLNAR